MRPLPEQRSDLAFDRNKSLIEAHTLSKPGFFARLFGRAGWQLERAWVYFLPRQFEGSRKAWLAAGHQLEKAREDLDTATSRVQQLEAVLDGKRSALRELQGRVDDAKQRLGKRVVDGEASSERGREKIQLTAPWLPNAPWQAGGIFGAALEATRRSSMLRQQEGVSQPQGSDERVTAGALLAGAQGAWGTCGRRSSWSSRSCRPRWRRSIGCR